MYVYLALGCSDLFFNSSSTEPHGPFICCFSPAYTWHSQKDSEVYGPMAPEAARTDMWPPLWKDGSPWRAPWSALRWLCMPMGAGARERLTCHGAGGPAVFDSLKPEHGFCLVGCSRHRGTPSRGGHPGGTGAAVGTGARNAASQQSAEDAEDWDVEEARPLHASPVIQPKVKHEQPLGPGDVAQGALMVTEFMAYTTYTPKELQDLRRQRLGEPIPAWLLPLWDEGADPFGSCYSRWLTQGQGNYSMTEWVTAAAWDSVRECRGAPGDCKPMADLCGTGPSYPRVGNEIPSDSFGPDT
nr:uncharacterized protein LOC123285598 [Equus asinus]